MRPSCPISRPSRNWPGDGSLRYEESAVVDRGRFWPPDAAVRVSSFGMSMSTIHPWRVLVIPVAGWINRHQQTVIACLVEENRILKGQLRGRILPLRRSKRLTDRGTRKPLLSQPDQSAPGYSSKNSSANDPVDFFPELKDNIENCPFKSSATEAS